MASEQFQLKAIISAVDKISPVLKAVQRSVKATHKSIRDIGKAGSELTARLGIPLAMLGGATIAGLTRAVSGFMELGSAINDTSAKIGINAEKLQELQYAGKLAGVAPETLTGGLTKLNKGLGEAAAGKNDELAALLKRLGISLRDTNGQVRSAADIMPQLADGIARNQNPAVRARMAVAAFGKSGQDLIPMLANGSAGLAEMADEARRLGIILSSDQVKAADDLGDTFDKLKLSVQGLGLNIGAKLAPVLTHVIERLTEWIVANREIIGQRVDEVVSRIAASIDKIDWNAVSDGIGSFISWVNSAADAVGGWSNLLLGLVVIANAGVIAAIMDIGAAVFRLIPIFYAAAKAMAVFAIANPVLAAVAIAAGLVAYAAFKIYQNWGGIADWFANLWQTIKSLFASGVQFLTDVFLNWNPLGLVIKNWEPIVNWFASLWERVRGFIEPITRGVSTAGEFFGVGAAASPRPALGSTGALQASGGQSKVNGEMVVRFENAPAGMRAEPGKTDQSGLAFNPDVGYRSMALVAP